MARLEKGGFSFYACFKQFVEEYSEESKEELVDESLEEPLEEPREESVEESTAARLEPDPKSCAKFGNIIKGSSEHPTWIGLAFGAYF